jgi:hypothetical protein
MVSAPAGMVRSLGLEDFHIGLISSPVFGALK